MELNYFTVKLTERIVSDFPDKIDDTEFIEQRSQLAALTYSEGSKQGLRHTEALKLANDTLFEGLCYSPYQLVKRVVDEEFTEEDDTEQGEFVMQMLNICKSLFEVYPINDKSFPGSNAEKELYTSITGEIQNYLKNNGMCY